MRQRDKDRSFLLKSGWTAIYCHQFHSWMWNNSSMKLKNYSREDAVYTQIELNKIKDRLVRAKTIKQLSELDK